MLSFPNLSILLFSEKEQCDKFERLVDNCDETTGRNRTRVCPHLKEKVEGCCECKLNHLYNGTQCILADQCGCVDEAGNPRRPGEMWDDLDQCLRYRCTGDHVVSKDRYPCPAEPTQCREVSLLSRGLLGTYCYTCV